MRSGSVRSNARVIAGLVGEFLREAAVLIAVFVPLDWSLQGKPLTPWNTAATLTSVLVLLVTGILLEVKAK